MRFACACGPSHTHRQGANCGCQLGRHACVIVGHAIDVRAEALRVRSVHEAATHSVVLRGRCGRELGQALLLDPNLVLAREARWERLVTMYRADLSTLSAAMMPRIYDRGLRHTTPSLGVMQPQSAKACVGPQPVIRKPWRARPKNCRPMQSERPTPEERWHLKHHRSERNARTGHGTDYTQGVSRNISNLGQTDEQVGDLVEERELLQPKDPREANGALAFLP